MPDETRSTTRKEKMEKLETVGEILEAGKVNKTPHITYHWDVQQRSEKWDALRCGVITASVMKNLMKKKTDKKTGEVSYYVPEDEKTKAYLFELAAQRINGWAPDGAQTYAMARGEKDEVEAFNLYSEKYAQLRTCGFITNNRHGVLLGMSPDGLSALNDDFYVEAKSRDPKFQAQTLYDNEMPDDFTIQVQTGLIVTERKRCDFLSYCGGMVMFVKPVLPDPMLQKTIILAAQEADAKINVIVQKVKENAQKGKFYMTEKRVEDITA